MKIILASASPRRKELLGYITKDFEVMVSNADESFQEGLTIQEQSKRIAYLKAKSVFDNTTGDRIVIGSDTLVLKNGEHFGKPKSEQEAFEMISRLQNDVHEVITSLCVIIEKDGKQKEYTDYDITKVYLLFHLLIVQLHIFFEQEYSLYLYFLYQLQQFFLFLVHLLFCLIHFVN